MKIFCAEAGGSAPSAQARRLLGFAFSEMYGRPAPLIAKSAAGRPYFPAEPQICFSLSHTRTYVMCALGDAPVGADVQIRRRVSPALPARVCAPDELAELDFFTLWSLKESYIKLMGAKTSAYSDIRFAKTPRIHLPEHPDIFCRVYDCIPGCSAAACSFSDTLPHRVIVVSRGDLDFSS